MTSGIGKCPEWLGDLARSEWDRMAEKLAAAGVAESVDVVEMETYCRAYETWRRAEAWISENGLVAIQRNDKGEVKAITAVPHVGIAKAAQSQMRQFLTGHGF